MLCPFCNHDDTRVIDSRVVENGHSVRRRRACEQCGKRFSTFEHVQQRLPLVVKKDATREAFSKEKLIHGFHRALEKRPVSAAAIDQAVQNVLQDLLEHGDAEITTESIGEAVMDALQELDGVAYVRFASVYREFKDVDEFLSAVQTAMHRSSAK